MLARQLSRKSAVVRGKGCEDAAWLQWHLNFTINGEGKVWGGELMGETNLEKEVLGKRNVKSVCVGRRAGRN